MIITIKAHNVNFVFNDWVGYRTEINPIDNEEIYPDLMRISNVFPYFDVEVGLVCIDGNEKYQADRLSCYWRMYATPEFKFLQEVYNKMYPDLIKYEDIDLAKSRIDDLMLKYNKLGCFL